MNFNNYKDFDKISLKIRINRKIYNSILMLEDEKLILNVDFTKESESIQNKIEHLDIINGNILYRNIELSLINCDYAGSEFSNQKFVLKYTVDRILYGIKIKKYKAKNINRFIAMYNGINCFTNDKPFEIDYNQLKYSADASNYQIITSSSNININFSSSISSSDSSLSILRTTSVNFESCTKVNLSEVLNEVYKFRNFLMLILKRDITVKEQYILFNNNKYRLFDCFTDDTYKYNKRLDELLNHRTLKIEQIDNLSTIYQNYIDQYEKLLPIIELFYNIIHFHVPNILKFVNSTTLLEQYCRKYNISSAIKLTQNIKPKKKDAEYQFMIETLINNVNDYYNLDQNQISTISINIKNARVQYIHYLEGSNQFELTYEQQFWYSSFIEDIVLLNIYKLLGLDITKYDYIALLDFYYSIENLM